MTYTDFCELFAGYGLDVVFITVLNAALCALLKRTLLKNKPRVITIIAYLAGTAFYAVYESVRLLDASYVVQNLVSVAEHGLSIGTLTILACAALDKFLGGGSSVTVSDALKEILSGFIPEEKTEECAAYLLAAAENGSADREEISKILKDETADGISEVETAMLTELVYQALARLCAKTEDSSATE